MIYLIDRGLRIKSASNVLVNHIKCPEIYNECFCLGCHVNVNDNQGTCFAYDLRSSFANQGICSADSVNDSVKDLPRSFANQGTNGVRCMPTVPQIMTMLMIMIYEVALLIKIMIMIMIYEVALLIVIMIMSLICAEASPIMLYINLKKNMVKSGKPSPIKRVNLTLSL